VKTQVHCSVALLANKDIRRKKAKKVTAYAEKTEKQKLDDWKPLAKNSLFGARTRGSPNPEGPGANREKNRRQGTWRCGKELGNGPEAQGGAVKLKENQAPNPVKSLRKTIIIAAGRSSKTGNPRLGRRWRACAKIGGINFPLPAPLARIAHKVERRLTVEHR